MRVRQRLMLSLTTLVGCTAVLGGAALVGMASLRHSYDAAEEQYQELRSLYEIGFRASSIRLLLNGSASDGAAIERHLFAASQEADRLRDRQAGSGGFGGDEIESVRASIQGRLRDVAGHVESGIDSEGLRADVNRWLGQVSTLATATQNGIVENRTQAKDRFRVAMEVMAGTFAATVLVAALVGTSQYRSVMVPLRALDAAVAEVAGIRFGRRLRERGDREFRRVTRHFNRMSRTIEEMHSSMRQQVEVKTRQLLRSEQLAGVGSLAAGLAHEINNPLAIIAGYAQTALRKLDNATTAVEREDSLDKARNTLRIICEETFRCRDIAAGLLSMAQPIDREPEVVDLDGLARRAVELVRRLPVARGREVSYRCDIPAAEQFCDGHPSQLLQVFLNLLTNGLEACPEEEGRVQLSLERFDGTIVATIADNGCGMDDQTLAHAFEPFFTDKNRRGLSGCGLGLSVSHAIVERHGGRLYAYSDGAGCGSTFTIELPKAPAESNDPRALPEHSDARAAW